jgi:four helix bundle protein
MGFNDEFRDRTKKFALRIIKLFQSLPKTDEARIIGKQLLRSATSVGANFRAATRARSRAEFYSKLSIADEEADESLFWMELLSEANILPIKRLESLLNEALEISKITSVSRRTFKNKSNKK